MKASRRMFVTSRITVDIKKLMLTFKYGKMTVTTFCFNQRIQYFIPIVLYTKSKNFQNFSVLAGGRCPPDPPLKRSFVTFDRGGQTGPPRSNALFFGAADDLQNDLRTIQWGVWGTLPASQNENFLNFFWGEIRS